MQKWLRVIAAGAVAAALLAGCGQAKQNVQRGAEGTPSPATAAASSPSPAPTATVLPKTASIQAYYGDEDGNKLVQQTVPIRYIADKDKYLAALNALRTSPDTKLMALCSGIDFKSAEEKNGTLTVNLVIQKGGQLGSGGEALLLQALQQTIFQYSEISAIDILVDGKSVDSLMGHMELPHPIKRTVK